MDLTEIMERHSEASSKWHKVKDAEFLVRLPTRKEVVLMVSGVNAAAPSMQEMFDMVDRCIEFISDWRGMTGPDGDVPFSVDLLHTLVDEDIEVGQALVDIVIGDFNKREEMVAGEKKH